MFLGRREPSALIVVLPRFLEPETKTTSQDIRVKIARMGDAEGRSTLAIRRSGIIVLFGIEVEIGFHAAGEYRWIVAPIRPESPDQASTTLRGGLNERAASARLLWVVGARLESIASQLAGPRSFAPFNPNPLSGNSQQIRTLERARTLGECQRAAQADQAIAQAVTDRASNDSAGEIGRIIETRRLFVERIFDDERNAALSDLIGKSHGMNLPSGWRYS
jgi:hypothetical protein